MLGRFTCRAAMISIAILSQSTMASQFITEGQFSVGANGAARYVVPIKVPAGVAGMEPRLSIVYDSSAGNGILGAGMDLAGFSRIERCKKTVAQDGAIKAVGFKQDDAYCLDGARLIPVAGVNGGDGTEYRTELDGFSKIVSMGTYNSTSPQWDPVAGRNVWVVGGPVSFTVYTKSGQTLEYGTSGDSQIKPGDDSMVSSGMYVPVIEGWALHKVSDRAGNYMVYTYTNISEANKSSPGSVPDDGNFRPVRIDYTGNAAAGLATSNYVVFGTPGVERTTPIQYEGGYVVPRSGVAMYGGAVETWAGRTGDNAGKRFSSYNVNADNNYDVLGDTGVRYLGRPFRAASIEECFGYSCLQPITFGWEGVNMGFQFKTSAFPGSQSDYLHFFVDVNGTGKKSWIQISQAYDDAWIGAANADGTFTSASWTRIAQSVGSLNTYGHYFADVNGDGKMDWIRVSRATNEAWVALGTGNGGFTFWSKYTQSPGALNANRHYFVDVDGDGRADWVQVAAVNGALQISFAPSNGDGTFQFWKTISGPIATSSYATYFTDIDGDGRIDLLLAIEGGTSAYLGSGDGKFTERGGFSVAGGAKSYNIADINGDGKTDVCAVKADNSSWCGFSMGDGNFTTPMWAVESRGVELFADVNGDGITDRITTGTTGNPLLVMLHSGNNSNYDVFAQGLLPSPDLPPGSQISSAGYQLLFADFDGDGRDDLILVDKANNKSFWGQSKYPTAGKIVSITDGFGAATTINYKFLNDASVYTPDADATGTLRDAIYPLLGLKRAPTVVSSTATSNGIGGTLNTTYTYGGLKTDRARRATLGFRWVQAVQQESGIATRTDYRQDWPLVGQVAASKRTIPGGGNNGVLGQTAYTFACTDFVSASGCSVAPGRRYFPYVTQSVTSSWDLNGAPLPVATSTYQFDAFGNPTQVVESTSDGFSKTTTTTYTNNTSKWWIGLPTRQTVRSDSP